MLMACITSQPAEMVLPAWTMPYWLLDMEFNMARWVKVLSREGAIILAVRACPNHVLVYPHKDC